MIGNGQIFLNHAAKLHSRVVGGLLWNNKILLICPFESLLISYSTVSRRSPTKPVFQFCSSRQFCSAIPEEEEKGPTGDLFHDHIKPGPNLLGKSASIRRTFGPNAAAQALLVCGGPALARHASFDPQYARARTWIHTHPVGPAVVGSILLQGLVGALVEAAVPQSVPMKANMTQIRPLIVGVEMEATVTVTDVKATEEGSYQHHHNDGTDVEDISRKGGYEVKLRTECKRVRDGSLLAEGSHVIWIPDHMHSC